MKRICKAVIAIMCSFCILANIGAFEKTASANFHLDYWNWYHDFQGIYYYECTLQGVPFYYFMIWDEDFHNIFKPNQNKKRDYYGYDYSNVVPVYVLEALLDIDLTNTPPREILQTVNNRDVNKSVTRDMTWIMHFIG